VGALEPFFRLQEIGQPLGDPDGPCRLGPLFEQVGHLPFQVQSVEKHQVGRFDPSQVPRRRHEQVRVHAGAHEGVHLNELTADGPRRVGNHAGGRQDLGLSVRQVGPRRAAVRLFTASAPGRSEATDY
jgi:hypothetical protein